MKHLLLILALMMSGCGAKLRPDPSPAAYPSNYARAEFMAGGKLWAGLGEVSLAPGQSYSQIDLKVQGYYEGVIEVDTSNCSTHETLQYDKSALVPIVLEGVAEKDCLVDFLVQPRYPGERRSGLDIYSFKGRLRIRVTDKPWMGYHSQIKRGLDGHIDIPAKEPLDILMFGCGARYSKRKEPVEGVIQLSVNELGATPFNRCTFEGDAGGTRITWQVWFYNDDFAPLPIPILDLKKDRLTVTSDPAVSVISLDGLYVLNYRGRFKFNPAVPHTLRLITVKGRSLIALWDPAKGVWEWI